MGQFIIFIDIKVVHGYYNDTPGSFRFRLTDETERLIRSRKVLFVHTANRCQFMLENDCAGFLRGDKLELTLQSQDDNFMRLTQLNGYRPQTFYRLALSDDSQEIDIASAIVATEEQRGEAHFCHITIQLTDKMLEDAKQESRRNTCSGSVRWLTDGNTCLCPVIKAWTNQRRFVWKIHKGSISLPFPRNTQILHLVEQCGGFFYLPHCVPKV